MRPGKVQLSIPAEVITCDVVPVTCIRKKFLQTIKQWRHYLIEDLEYKTNFISVWDCIMMSINQPKLSGGT